MQSLRTTSPDPLPGIKTFLITINPKSTNIALGKEAKSVTYSNPRVVPYYQSTKMDKRNEIDVYIRSEYETKHITVIIDFCGVDNELLLRKALVKLRQDCRDYQIFISAKSEWVKVWQPNLPLIPVVEEVCPESPPSVNAKTLKTLFLLQSINIF